MTTICYLRTGRKLRATGTVIALDRGNVKVKPTRSSWGMIWITQAELSAGTETCPGIDRKYPANDTQDKKRDYQPKRKLKPRWKQLVEEIRIMELDHKPDGRPRVEMRFLSELADEIEAAHAKREQFLPINTP